MKRQPFTIRAEQEALDDLRLRLKNVRWPDQPEGAGWDDGTELAYLRELVAYWERTFNWRAQEMYFNQFSQFHADTDGTRISFIHERGTGPNPLPSVLTHGWPGTFAEFLPVIPLLTDPDAHGGGLNDDPGGLAAWIIEKFRAWSDCDGDIERRFTKDELLRIVMLYWLSGTIGSSFHVYRDWALGAESNPYAWADRDDVPRGIASKPLARDERIDVPTALALFPADPPSGIPREWVERSYTDLRRFARLPRGGHFPGLEEPDLLAEDLRAFVRPFRPGPRLGS